MSPRGPVERAPRHEATPHVGVLLATALFGCIEISFGTGGAGGVGAGGVGSGGASSTTSGGADPTSGGAGGGTAGAGATGGAGGSNGLPEGWSGLVELGGCDESADVLLSSVEAPATCDCPCTAACEVELQQYPFTSCFTLPNVAQLTSGVCFPLANNTDSLRFTRQATCMSTPTPTPVAVETVALCESASAACIHRDGEQQCPPSHPVKTRLFRSVVDERECDANGNGCSCDATCVADQAVFPDAACQDAAQVVTNNQCVSNAQLGSVLVEATAMCVATGEGRAEGGVFLDEPVTVCCP